MKLIESHSIKSFEILIILWLWIFFSFFFTLIWLLFRTKLALKIISLRAIIFYHGSSVLALILIMLLLIEQDCFMFHSPGDKKLYNLSSFGKFSDKDWKMSLRHSGCLVYRCISWFNFMLQKYCLSVFHSEISIFKSS